MAHEDQPNWRDDPSNSSSDWKIKITTSTNDRTATYHVHKAILAHGPRRSAFFAEIFQNDFMANEMNTSSSFRLDSHAASAFPALLDYIYGADLEISTNNATSLHYLSEYLKINQLKLESLHFCHENMSLENLHIYYILAKLLNDTAVKNLVTVFLKNNMHDVRPEHPIVEESDPQLWIDAMTKDHAGTQIEDTRQLSKVIAKICRISTTLDTETFERLVDPLTWIDSSVALELWRLAEYLYPKDLNCILPGHLLLMKRCVDALSKDPSPLRELNQYQVQILMQTSPQFLVNLLLKTVAVDHE
jgi:hypothetical protein